ncbi:hypothetical protein L596_010664 [Steinernema carpocapsae]|uniref:WAP domain-containing protein n=1 Tax=Steinernema carpocapsae TaxID=34508 RepID=A0A4U5PJA3_STECR|nr:hypothetical protein L596_010664 [Steinernema carpocapsae]
MWLNWFAAISLFCIGTAFAYGEYPPKSSQNTSFPEFQRYQYWEFNDNWDTCLGKTTTEVYDYYFNCHECVDRAACIRSTVVDGTACLGPPEGHQGAPAKAKTDLQEICVECPDGYFCQPVGSYLGGPGGYGCCNSDYERFYLEGNSGTCPDGSDAPTENGETFLAENCDNLICDDGQKCIQVNPYFAKCCYSN